MKPRREGDGSGSTSSEQGPRFYSKVVHNSAIEHGLLRLPQSFVEDHRESLSTDRVRLETPNGAVWAMEVMRLEDLIFLRDGWPEFLKFYSICQAYHLLFRDRGNCNFRVRIIDRSFREITYPPKPTRDHHVENVITESRKRKPNSVAPNVQSDGNGNGGTTRKKSSLAPSSSEQETSANGRSATRNVNPDVEIISESDSEQETNMALQKAEAFESKIEKPSFLVILGVTYARGDYLAIPTPFARDYLAGKEETTFTLQVLNGKGYWKMSTSMPFVLDLKWVGVINKLVSCLSDLLRWVGMKKMGTQKGIFIMTPPREGGSTSSEQGPRYYTKVVHDSAIKYGLLRLPKIFGKDHGESLSDRVRLETPNGAVWPMEVIKLEDDYLLRNGWPEFLKFYSICQAHQLLFKYHGNSNLSVRVIDRSFREIKYPPKPRRDVANVDEFRKRNRNSLAPNVQSDGNENGGTMRKKSNLASSSSPEEETNMALQKAQALQSKIQNPFFLIVMRPTYARGNYLAIPAAFAQKYLAGKEETTFTLEVSNGKGWKGTQKGIFIMKPGDGSGSTLSEQEQGPPYYSKRLPQSFVEDHRESLSDRVRVETPNGAVWPMEVIYVEKEIFLRDGWPEFAAFYSICQAYHLLLIYRGNSNLSVRIIDRSFREIKYPPKPTRDHVENVVNESPKRKRNSEAPNVQSDGNENGGSMRKKSNLASSSSPKQETNITVQQAEALQSKIENPSFLIVMRPTYARNYLALPAAFAKKYLAGKEETSFTLEVSNGKRWKVDYGITIRGARLKSSGWKAVVKENKLKEDDVCVFELVEQTQVKFKVYVFRN
ncbi:hypothetical protein COLO4_11317 [Corchorus olitorius]|uniref:TF-B3 domain-containing protein n=1 Tax=Corchorus olitorius TaxID=93759 RepID=A0A1R3K4V9_9ROSI|nr:hypothetical protein COLO4_11317 [Corchorus olitorius]